MSLTSWRSSLQNVPNSQLVIGVVSSSLLAFIAFKYLSKPKSLRNHRLPNKMKVVHLTKFVAKHSKNAEDYAENLQTVEVEVPKPKAGEVLVQIKCSSINPSDLSHLTGTYNSAQRERLPCQVGFEGSGLVVQSGGGFLANSLVGKRVGVCSTKGGRFWGEYAIVDSKMCITLPSDASFEEGASCFVNPMTVISFVEIAEARKQRAIIHTAAASALGKMLIRYAKLRGIEIICLVRRDEQVQELRNIGAKYVLNTSVEGWEEELKRVCEQTKCQLGFDAVAGPLSGAILRAMPPKSSLKVYGGLGFEHCSGVRPTDLIFADKKLEGYWLSSYLKTKSIFGVIRWTRIVRKNIRGALGTHIRKTYPLEQAGAAVADYVGDMSGKVAITPNAN